MKKSNKIEVIQKTVNQTFLEFPSEIIFELNDSDRQRIKSLCRNLLSPTLNDLRLMSWWNEASLQSDGLSSWIRKLLREFRCNSNDYGAILLRGIPIEENLPPTPLDDGIFANKNVSNSEKSFAMVMMRLGEPRGCLDEKNGLPLQNVYPVLGFEKKQENSGSVEFLDMHGEDIFNPNKCDTLGLLGLRNDHDKVARTGVASCRKAINLVSENTITWLRKPLYIVPSPSSYGEQVFWSKPMPVLCGSYFHPFMNIEVDVMKGVTPQAQLAFEEFSEALWQVHISTVILPGDLLIIDNMVTAHTRSGFRPHYDGKDRWLQRIKVLSDPRQGLLSRKPEEAFFGRVAFDFDSVNG